MYYRPRCFAHEITKVGTDRLMTEHEGLQRTVYKTMTFELDPPRIGKPNKRPRRVSCGWLAVEGVRFHGSENEFWELMARKCVVNGSIFFTMDDERALEDRERAALHKNYIRHDGHVGLEYQFTSKTHATIEQHCDLRGTHQGIDGAFLLDAEHTPKFSTPGPHPPPSWIRNILSKLRCTAEHNIANMEKVHVFSRQ